MDVTHDFPTRQVFSRGSRLRVAIELRRARRLVSRRRRRRLAGQLERLVEVAEGPQGFHGAAVPVNSNEVLRCRGLLYSLAAELDGDEAVAPRGVRLVQELLRDGGSPVYARAPEGALKLELRRARSALLLL